MKTTAIMFAGDTVHEGPVGSCAANTLLPGLRVSRMILNPTARVLEKPTGSVSVIIFAGVGMASWRKPGEDQVRVKVTEGDIILLPAGVACELENHDTQEPLIYVVTEAA